MADNPDLAILLVAANRCLDDRLVAAVRQAGARDMRPAFGFVIRAVAAEEPTVGRRARRGRVAPRAARLRRARGRARGGPRAALARAAVVALAPYADEPRAGGRQGVVGDEPLLDRP